MENKKTEELIEQFFEGLTSNREEKEIYDFFTKADIPEHLQKYKPVFAYFKNGLQARQPKKKQIWIRTGIAVSLMAAIGLGILQPWNTRNFNPYEGSYIIRKGVKITDPEIIRPEIERSLYRVSMQEEISTRMQDQFEEQVLMYEQ
jgi:hypothetical protein